MVRQAGWRSGVTGLGSALFIGSGWAADRLDARLGAGGRVRRLPVAVPAGLLLAAEQEWQRRRSLPETSADPEGAQAALAASLGVGAGVTAGLAVMAFAEERLASAIDRALARRVPGSEGMWRIVGHAAVLGAVGAGGMALWTRAMQRVESAVLTVDPVLAHEADDQWALESCSGSAKSLVSWESLDREGRRHVVTAVRTEPLREPSARASGSVPPDGHRPARPGHTGPGVHRARRRPHRHESGSTSPWRRWTAPERGIASSSCSSPPPAPVT